MRVQNRLHPLHPGQLDQRLDSQVGLATINLPSTADTANINSADSATLLSPFVEVQNREAELTSGDGNSLAATRKDDVTSSDITQTSHDLNKAHQVKGEEESCSWEVGGDDDLRSEEKVQQGDLSLERSPKSPSKAIGSNTASPSRHQHTSQSWSGDDRGDASISLSPKPSSYSTHFPLEHLPPLLSYDEADENCGRSPRLHGNIEVLSEEEQLTLHASMSDIATSHSDQSDGEEAKSGGKK